MDAKLLLVGVFVMFFIAWITKKHVITYSNEQQSMIKNSIKQCKDWYNISLTTKKGFDAAISATRAAVYLDSIRISTPDTDIEKITGVDITKLISNVENNQVEKIKTVDPATESSAIANIIR